MGLYLCRAIDNIKNASGHIFSCDATNISSTSLKNLLKCGPIL